MYSKKDSYFDEDTRVESFTYGFSSRAKTITVFKLGYSFIGFSILTKKQPDQMIVYQYDVETGEDYRIYRQSLYGDYATYSQPETPFPYRDQIDELSEFSGEIMHSGVEFICDVLRSKSEI